jgi:hypothetical protein
MIELIEALVRGKSREAREIAIHDLAVTATAKRSERDPAETVAALRALGHTGAADAFENLAWEASFERDKFTSSGPRPELPALRR